MIWTGRQVDSHFKLSELGPLCVGTAQVGPERDGDFGVFRRSVDLPSFGDSRPEIFNYALRQCGCGRGFDSLTERDESQVKGRLDSEPSLQLSLADEICMLDRTKTGKQTAVHPLVGIDVPHDVGAAVLHLFHDRAQLFKRVFVVRRMAFRPKNYVAGNKYLSWLAPLGSSSHAALRTLSIPSAMTDMTE